MTEIDREKPDAAVVQQGDGSALCWQQQFAPPGLASKAGLADASNAL